MKRSLNHWIPRALAVLVSLAFCGSAFTARADDRKDARIITDFGADDPRVVENALEALEVQVPPSEKVVAQARPLLADPRPTVREKAALVLGKIHAKLDDKDFDAICFMLKSHDEREVDDALKTLANLNATQTVPRILPLLTNSRPATVRSACRTLAVVGNKEVIPSLEPLLNHHDSGVKDEARKAIATLRAKPDDHSK